MNILTLQNDFMTFLFNNYDLIDLNVIICELIIIIN